MTGCEDDGCFDNSTGEPPQRCQLPDRNGIRTDSGCALVKRLAQVEGAQVLGQSFRLCGAGIRQKNGASCDAQDDYELRI